MDKLFSEFPPVSTQQWIETIRKDLKGKDIEKLNRITIDGLKFSPFYRRENTENLETVDAPAYGFPFLRSAKKTNSWLIRHDFQFSNKDNLKTITDFAKDRELDVVGIDFGEEFSISKDNFLSIVDKFDNLALSAHNGIEKAYYYLVENSIFNKKIYLNFDPITLKTFTGGFRVDENKIWTYTADFLSNEYQNIKPVGINIYHFANAGATPVQQIAFALSVLTEYLDFATEMNLSLDLVLQNIYFNFAFGSEYFLEIAKIRAFRYLFSKLISAYDEKLADDTKPFIHGTNTLRNKTIYDPYVNMLRTSIETFAGILAGVDSFSVLPYDAIFRKPDEFSNRIAVNQQIILKYEVFADRVIDPSGGSYYVENLTYKLIESAWKLFLDIQEKGGFCDALKQNYIFSLVDEVDKKEQNAVNTGKISLLGTNKYPNRAEKLDFKNLEPVSYISDFKVDNSLFKSLNIRRLSAGFEQLRMNVEKMSNIPKVFIFPFGNLAMRRARADFAINFYASAGFEIIDNIGFDSIDAGINEIKKLNPEIIVLCSSDDEYFEAVKKIYPLLKDKFIVIAGNPPTRNEIENLGIKNFIHIKTNIYDELVKTFNFFSNNQ